MGQKTITDVYLTCNELIEVFQGIEEMYPEILLHVAGPKSYEVCPDATFAGCLRQANAISVALPGTIALMPYSSGDSPYRRGAIHCVNPENGPGVIEPTFIATLPEAIPDLELRAACLKRFNQLRRQIHKVSDTPVTFVSTIGKPSIKQKMSQGAIEFVTRGGYLSESGLLSARKRYNSTTSVEEAVQPPNRYVDELPGKPPVYL